MHLQVLPVHHFGGEQHILEAAAGNILQRLPASVIVHARPGSHRPAVIHLPVQSSHAVWLVSAVALNRHPHSLRLQNLAHVQE
ncbi:hypothetical protein D3C73_1219610 [compost metagenome]